MLGEELFEVVSVQQQRPNEAVTLAVFDPLEELLWTGSNQGSIHSYVAPALERYTCFSSFAVGQPVVGLLCAQDGVLSASKDAVRMHARGGLPLLTFRDRALSGVLCMDWERAIGGRILLGQSSASVAMLDLSKQRIVTSAPTGQGVAVMRAGGRLLACGGSGGELSLLDPRTLRVEHTLDAHAGAISCLDVKGDLLVSCGITQRMGQVFCDTLVKVFDVRMSPRPLTHISFPPGPSLLKFQPKFSSTLLVAAQTGAFLLTDVQGGGINFRNYQVECEGDMLLSCAVSSSGEAIAFGDSGGFVHLFSTQEEPHVNLLSQPTELPDLLPPPPQVALDENGTFAAAHCPSFLELPLSAFDPAATMKVGLPPRVVDSALLDQMKQVDFVGYVSNPHWRRGQPYGEASRAVAVLRTKRQKRKSDRWGALERMSALRAFGVGRRRLPKGYWRVEIKQSQSKLKFEEFDFSYYNKTRFAGLENDIANCYCNALLQVLYFIPALRATLSQHICEKEFCLTCELGFILHMLDLAEGDTAQPSNLLRALKQIREAAALGLVEGPDELDTSKERSVAVRIQSFCRFLLEQLHKEAGGGAGAPGGEGTMPDRLFGSTVRTITRCLKGPHQETRRDTRSFLFDLQYSGRQAGGPRPSFSSILERSLGRVEDMRAWCPSCRSYQLLQQSRTPTTLPPTLLLNAAIRSDQDLWYWTGEAGEGKGSTPRGGSGGRGQGHQRSDSGKELQAGSEQWLPFQVEVEVEVETGRVTVTEDMGPPLPALLPAAEAFRHSKDVAMEGSTGSPPGTVRARYELTAMVANILEDDDEDSADWAGSSGHLVAHIKVPSAYREAEGGASLSPHMGSLSPSASPYTSQRSLGRSGSPAAVPAPSTPTTYGADGALLRAALERQGSSGMERHLSSGRHSDWVLFNDFCITPTSALEVVTLYGRQKVPCLLFYTRMDSAPLLPSGLATPTPYSPSPASPAGGLSSPSTFPPHISIASPRTPRMPTPIRSLLRRSPVTDELFAKLTAESRLWLTHSAEAPFKTFWPLDFPQEAPRPGMAVGIDAEFVALSAPEKGQRDDGQEFVKRPARLGLARISVVRGEGPKAGTCCIDDYIRSVEPVYDYLTRYSGLVHGDLDPSTSKHHITTLKKAYIKLRFLVDKGCRFVGHGLKKDFRMINLVVPPEQIIDTVELFHFKRQRKISLRFLASYLLQLDIQKETHDSIEDAKTALRLYDKYKELIVSGEFHDKLLEIYRYGRRHGWEVLNDGSRGSPEDALSTQKPSSQ